MPMRRAFIACMTTVLLAGPQRGAGLSQNQSPSSAPQGEVRSEVDLVSVYFTVRNDKKQLVSDLPQDTFRVAEDGQPQTIKFFAHHSDVVLNVGVLLDTGTRMDWLLDEEGHAASLFLRHVVRPSDLGFVVSYAASVNTLQLPTSDMPLLQASVRRIPSGGGEVSPAPEGTGAVPEIGVGAGGTVGINGKPVQMNRVARLYDAIQFSAEHYLQGEVGRKAVVVVALSGDAKSQTKLEEALETLLENDVIHTYARDEHGEYVLKKLAEATGGRMLEVKGMDRIDDALDEISEELHHQYSLGYYPANKQWDGKFRKIQITTAGEAYKVSARRGYYAKRPTAKAADANP